MNVVLEQTLGGGLEQSSPGGGGRPVPTVAAEPATAHADNAPIERTHANNRVRRLMSENSPGVTVSGASTCVMVRSLSHLHSTL